jgi:hypothetical protein
MTGNSDMPATLRLSNSEQEAIRQKCIEINKLLIKRGSQPVRDSELAHFVIDRAIEFVQVNLQGELEIEIPE